MSDDFAEEVPPEPDPLDGLPERLKDDVAIAYSDNVIKAVAKLKQTNPGKFVELIRDLKKFKHENPQSGFELTLFREMVDKAVAADSVFVGDGAIDVATQLVNLSLAAKQHFLDVNTGEVYADFEVEADGVIYPMTGPVQGTAYERWLGMRFYETTKRAPPREGFKSAIRTIEARTFASKQSFRLFPRICQMLDRNGDPVIYLDRGSDAWDAFRIDHNGVELITDSPVKFVRPESGIAELPKPQWGGSIDDLEGMLNLRSRRDFILGVGFILSCYQPTSALLQALLMGQHGTAKTTAEKRFCALIDPILNDPLAPPDNVNDLMIIAQTTYVMAFDNVKRISEAMSAAYCRLSTGGGMRKRILYTDKGLLGLWARRPLIQTSTRMVVKEPDLANRTVLIGSGAPFQLDQEDNYRPEDEVEDEFIAAWPKLFGAILTAVVEGLRHRKAGEPVPRRGIPRMASFGVWSYRCELGLGWERDTILNAYREAVRDFAQDIVELDAVASSIVTFMMKHVDGWEGSATTLLALLNAQDAGRGPRSRDWPRDAHDLSSQLSELTDALLRNGLRVVWGRNEAERRRSIAMTWVAKPNGENHANATPHKENPFKSKSWRPVT